MVHAKFWPQMPASEVMDHHGLVPAMCRDLKIAERINERVGSRDPRRVIQPGVSVVAMIINGLGLTNRRLYLTPQFYQSKAIGRLLGGAVSAKDLHDHALGKALDEISKYGATRLFGELAFELGVEQGLLGKLAQRGLKLPKVRVFSRQKHYHWKCFLSVLDLLR